MERMPIWQVAIKRLDMPIQRFLFIFVGGAALTGLIGAILVVFLTGGLGDGALFQGFAGVFMILLLPISTIRIPSKSGSSYYTSTSTN